MSTSYNLDGIRVQTARMLEIYSLLRRELEGANKIGMPQEARGRLQPTWRSLRPNLPLQRKLLPPSTTMEVSNTPESDGSTPSRPGNWKRSSIRSLSGTPS